MCLHAPSRHGSSWQPPSDQTKLFSGSAQPSNSWPENALPHSRSAVSEQVWTQARDRALAQETQASTRADNLTGTSQITANRYRSNTLRLAGKVRNPCL